MYVSVLFLFLSQIHLCPQNLAAETAAYLTTKHPDYAILAARIAVSNLHKETKKSFSHVIFDLYNYGKQLTTGNNPFSSFSSKSQDWQTGTNDLERDIRGRS